MLNKRALYWTFGILAAGYVGALAYRQFTLLSDTEFKVKNIVKKTATLRSIEVELTAEIVNHSSFSFVVTSQDFNVLYNGKFIGTVKSIESIDIPKKGSAISKYTILIDPTLLLTTGNLFSGKFQLKGGINTSSGKILIGRIPINISLNLAEMIK